MSSSFQSFQHEGKLSFLSSLLQPTIIIMSKLGDDEMTLILNCLSDPKDRDSFSLVCKQWLRVEGQSRTSIRVLDLDLLHKFLPRFPNLLSFESQSLISDTYLHFLAKTCPNLESLNLSLRQSNFDEFSMSFDDVGDDGICGVANVCLRLRKVLLRRRKNIGDDGVVCLANCAQNLTHLDLWKCSLIGDKALEAIGGLSLIQVLNFGGCSLITDRGLVFLATGSASRSLKRLILEECDRITDFGVSFLQHLCCLEELNLAECGPKVTDDGGMAIASIRTLKRLDFSWLINMSDITLVAIAEKCKDLVKLNLTGCEMITGAGIRAFGSHECLESLVLASCYNLAGDDLNVLFRCRTLTIVVLGKSLRKWIPLDVLENISRFCQIHWR